MTLLLAFQVCDFVYTQGAGFQHLLIQGHFPSGLGCSWCAVLSSSGMCLEQHWGSWWLGVWIPEPGLPTTLCQ